MTYCVTQSLANAVAAVPFWALPFSLFIDSPWSDSGDPAYLAWPDLT